MQEQNNKPTRAYKLSPRELQITKFLAYGYTDKRIAERLEISARTVQTHITHIVIKLRADNRTHAVAIALKEGLIT